MFVYSALFATYLHYTAVRQSVTTLCYLVRRPRAQHKVRLHKVRLHKADGTRLRKSIEFSQSSDLFMACHHIPVGGFFHCTSWFMAKMAPGDQKNCRKYSMRCS